MGRSNRSARQAGTRFERLIADSLAEHVDDRIDRRVKTGAADKGDIANLRLPTLGAAGKIVVEAKDTSRTNLSGWVREAEAERVNDGALVGMVVHKRRGHGDPLDQYVTCTVRDLVALICGARP